MKLGAATLVAVLVCGVTLFRVSHADHPVRRPRWLTLCLDEPVFAHFGATLVAFPLWVLAGVGVLGARALGVEPTFSLAGHELLDWNGLAALSYLAGLGLSTWAVWGRRRWIREGTRELALGQLPASFDGYRIVHLSDLHIGNFDTRRRGLRWSALASSQKPDAIVVTGDLVTAGSLFYEDVADVIGALRARDGVFVSLGNHDQADPSELVRALEQRGATVLQNRCVAVERGRERLVFAGLDDAYTGRDDLDATLAHCGGDATILLSHYPRFFPAAAQRHVSLVLSGHTHGGQVGIPFLSHRFSVSSLIEHYIHGVYRLGDTLLHVSSGLGTTGAPLRLGSSPEITTLVLRRAAGAPYPAPGN
jgi:predicted MPP superfamily phosphohydrolase